MTQTMMETATTVEVPLQPAIGNFAQALAESAEFQAFEEAAAQLQADRQAQDELQANGEAGALLEQLTLAQNNLRRQQMSGSFDAGDVAQMQTLQQKAMANDLIMDFVRAQEEVLAYLPTVNMEISQLLGLDFAALSGAGGC